MENVWFDVRIRANPFETYKLHDVIKIWRIIYLLEFGSCEINENFQERIQW